MILGGRLFTSARDEGGIDVVRIESDLNFLNAARIKVAI